MSRYHSYLNSSKEFLSQYQGEEPFSFFIKKKFSADKKYGSKDRKQIAHLCYCFFRLGKAAANLPLEQRIIAGLFLCSDTPNDMLQALNETWNENATISINEKLKLLPGEYTMETVFPWKNELSEGIEHENFSCSFFIQPDLFIRIRPGQKETVVAKSNSRQIPFTLIDEYCVSFPNATKIDELIEADKEAVIQDYNSQKTLDAVKNEIGKAQGKTVVWDCCAASGGKSILAKDSLDKIDLIVSDVRESILNNLEKRFAKAGIKSFKSFTADLLKPVKQIAAGSIDLLIADVPCSGSGTWSRTPEQLCFFEEKKIDEYASLQREIINNIIPAIKPGGYLLFITCSVFRKENEDAIAFIKSKENLELIEMNLLKGYDRKADTLFTALLKKPL